MSLPLSEITPIGRPVKLAETFAGTLQGEGPSTGQPAAFIRFSGCNLTCGWCDTPYTWDTSRYDLAAESYRENVDALVAWASECSEDLIVITGGEPLLQRSVVPLVQQLWQAGKQIEVETNGTIAPPAELLAAGPRFNVSPKLGNSGVKEDRRIVPAALREFAASGLARFKFVVQDIADLAEVEALERAYGLSPIWVMPEGKAEAEVLAGMRALAGPVVSRGWRLGTRLHVLLWGDERGR
ncbi:MAG: 7-carboxy-7-deazaguanine synthase QueE [Pseudonocardiaceae bacterium]